VIKPLSVLFALAFLLTFQVIPSGECEAASNGFTLQDFLGREWHNEAVRFPLSPGELRAAETKRALVDSHGDTVTYQIVKGEGAAGPTVEFGATLKAFESRTYRFIERAGTEATDLVVNETADAVELRNSRVGVTLRKALRPGQGPIQNVRLASGNAAGDSAIDTRQRIKSYSVSVATRGPVSAHVICRIHFEEGGVWELHLRLQAYEPIIAVDENFSTGDASAFLLDFNKGFAPTNIFYRYGKGTATDANAVGQLASTAISASDKEPAFVLEPWLFWWERQRQGTWFSLYNDRQPDLLAVGTRAAAVWVDPNEKPENRSGTKLLLTADRDRLVLTLPLKRGARSWLIGAFDKEESLKPLHGGSLHVSPLPQQYFAKHGVFELSRIKDYVLKWPDAGATHPRLLVAPNELNAWRATFRSDSARLAALTREPLYQHTMDDAIAYYLGTQDRELGRHLAATAVQWLQSAVDMFVQQRAMPALGFAPHQQTTLLSAVILADSVISSAHVSAELRQRMNAQIAFLAYTVNRTDYWSPERGFSANPNMTSAVAAYQTMLGCMIREHPMARTWVANGMRELKDNQLDRWSDSKGGWLEAPHYAMLSYDYLLGSFLAAYRAGFNDYLYDARMKSVIEWLAKIATPPDAAAGGIRYRAPIGNTYMREPSGTFGTVAHLWKTRDPRFAAEMQWMYRQQGSFAAPGVGGFFPALAGFRKILLDTAIAPTAPAYTSEWFPSTGVMLRSHFPSDRETQLHLIAGDNHTHYDQDSGSFTLWAKGRIVANDFGYHGRAPGDEHNMIVSPRAADSALMYVTQFVPAAEADYVSGRKSDAWERQIVFVKDTDALGPNYVVLRDTVKDSPSVWRTWFTAQKLVQAGQGATAEGRDDVDTDIFFASGNAVAPTTHEATRKTWGVTGGRYGEVSTTQLGLAVAFKSAAALTTVMYPRLKTERKPVFTSIADGKGVKVQTDSGTDYVFVSAEPFTYGEGTLRFQGSVGAVLVRNGDTRLWLGRAGTIAAQGKSLRQPDSARAQTR
jgi:hypothetical protein